MSPAVVSDGAVGPWTKMPALLTSTSRCPDSSPMTAAAASTLAWSVTSRARKRTSRRSAASSSAARRPRPASREPRYTTYLASASWAAMARPIPLLAPVTRAMSFGMSLLNLRSALNLLLVHYHYMTPHYAVDWRGATARRPARARWPPVARAAWRLPGNDSQHRPAGRALERSRCYARRERGADQGSARPARG